MKRALNLFITLVFSFFFACHSPEIKSGKNIKINVDTESWVDHSRNDLIRKNERLAELDSLFRDKVLSESLFIAKKHLKLKKYKKDFFKVPSDTGINELRVNLTMGAIFNRNSKHLMVKIISSYYFSINIYSIENEKFIKVVSDKIDSNDGIDPTEIWDINGDGLKDLIVHWYPESGCCLRDVNYVYLLRPNRKSFSLNYEFINPTFFPQEKIIRGVDYGHAEYTDLYKFRWRGDKVDTLEYVYYERIENKKTGMEEKTGRVVISKKAFDNKEIIARLNSVPKEFRNIFGYFWFTGKGLE